jgi:hypothetical protein
MKIFRVNPAALRRVKYTLIVWWNWNQRDCFVVGGTVRIPGNPGNRELQAAIASRHLQRGACRALQTDGRLHNVLICQQKRGIASRIEKFGGSESKCSSGHVIPQMRMSWTKTNCSTNWTKNSMDLVAADKPGTSARPQISLHSD